MRTPTIAPSPELLLKRSAQRLLAALAAAAVLTALLLLVLLGFPLAQLSYRGVLSAGAIVAGLAGLALAYALRPRRRRRQGAAYQAPLPRAGAAPLYALVESIAREAGLTQPVHLHLDGAVGVALVLRRAWHGRLKSLEVVLGLPLIGILSDKELGALVAHEFGHVVPGEVALGPLIYRIRLALVATVTRLDDTLFLPELLVRRLGLWFLAASAPLARVQELAADALAARLFGAFVTSRALCKVVLIEPMWSAYFEHELSPALARGARLPIFEGFRQFCKPGARRADVQASITRAENRAREQFDAHPSLSERVAALVAGSRPSFPPLADSFALLGGEAATEQAWYALFPREGLVDTGWDRYGVEVLQAQIGRRFAGSWMDPQVLPIIELKTMAAHPEQLWNKLRPEGVSTLSPLGRRKHVLAILDEWLIGCLILRGFAVLDIRVLGMACHSFLVSLPARLLARR